eukprot:3226850-Amphidinium_carterae.2
MKKQQPPSCTSQALMQKRRKRALSSCHMHAHGTEWGITAHVQEEEPDLQADMLSPFRGLWRKAMANLGKTPDRIDGS